MSRPTRASGLLHELCVKHGHCGSAIHVTDLIPKEGTISAEQFAQKMLEAEYPEGLEHDPKQRDADLALYRSKFGQHLGSDPVDVMLFHG